MIKAFFQSRTKLKRTIFFVLVDGLLLSFSLYLSFYLRFDGNIKPEYIDKFWRYLIVFLSVKYITFTVFRLYRISWSYVGFYELLNMLMANTVNLFLLSGIVYMFWFHNLFSGFPRSIPVLDFVISLVLIVMFRTSKRVYLQLWNETNSVDTKRTLIIGAGNAGEQIVRDVRRQKSSPYTPVGFIDDDVMKHGIYIQGVKVYGSRKDIAQVVKELNVDLVLLAMPSASSRDIRDILSYVRKSLVKEIKTIPGFNELVNRNISVSDIKEIRVEDIIGREQVTIDKKIVTSFTKPDPIPLFRCNGSTNNPPIS